MDMEQLVQRIAQEVLRKLSEKEEKPCVKVLCAKKAVSLQKIIAVLDGEYDLFFLDEETGSREPFRYLVPFLSCHAMAELAVGSASKPLTAGILQLLLAGKTVEVLEFEYIGYSETAREPLYALYDSYVKTLESFGLVALQKKRPETVRVRERLITEALIAHIHATGAATLYVPQNAIITPLASEMAQELGLNILKRL